VHAFYSEGSARRAYIALHFLRCAERVLYRIHCWAPPYAVAEVPDSWVRPKVVASGGGQPLK
jgi:hypothetical protein